MLYSELQCSEAIHKAVERMGFAELTEIQEKTIPVMPGQHDGDGLFLHLGHFRKAHPLYGLMDGLAAL